MGRESLLYSKDESIGTPDPLCWMGDWCQPNNYTCPPVCHMPAPSLCDENSHACDMGWYGSCWMGDYCVPLEETCPVACYSPLPSRCDADSQVCDAGTDMHGCWMGDWCQSLDYPC